MSDRSINVGGNFIGNAMTGDHNIIAAQSDGVETYLRSVLSELHDQFSDTSDTFRIEILQSRLRSDMAKNPVLRGQLKSALLNASEALLGVLTDNPFVKVSAAMLIGWLK
ncbi:MAG: hypothetical protein OIF55_06045 [Amphritea sp.]|nr:hypothetical protein [Amphritea sp.]